MLLKVYAERSVADGTNEMHGVLESVLEENFIITSPGLPNNLALLISSIQIMAKTSVNDGIYMFLDNCFQRIAKRTVHYYDLFQELRRSSAPPAEDAGLLIIAAAEQLNYLADQHDTELPDVAARWFKYFVSSSLRASADKSLIQSICNGCLSKDTLRTCGLAFESLVQEIIEAEEDSKRRMDSPMEEADISKEPSETKLRLAAPSNLAASLPSGPKAEDEQHPGLRKWAKEDVSDAIRDGLLDELIMCLCSQHRDIRLQAIAHLTSIMSTLEVWAPVGTTSRTS